MNLSRQTITSGGATLTIAAPKKLGGFLTHPFLGAHIPSARVFGGGTTDGGRLTVGFGKTTALDHASPKSFVLKVKTNITPEDYVSILEYVLEYFRQSRGVYCIHSASVIDRGRAEVFWGAATGMGKSRTARFLAEKMGMKMNSDEKTLISLKQREVIGGVQTVSLHHRYHAKRSAPKEPKFADASRSYAIKRLYYVHNLGRQASEAEIFPWTSPTFEWHLYEELSRKIRGVSRRIDAFTTPLPSLDTERLAMSRSRAVHAFCRQVTCVYIRADESRIRKYFSRNA